MSPSEPGIRRACVFVDGQNLFHSAKAAFGIQEPRYDVRALSGSVCGRQGWELVRVFFYTGIPDRTRNPKWHDFWQRRLMEMKRVGVQTFSRPLRYRNRLADLGGGRTEQAVTGEEKGIDVRIAVDMIRYFHERLFDVALVFSQDQDLSEATDELRRLARQQGRWLKVASAFPVGSGNGRGINRTDWLPIGRQEYVSSLLP